MVFAAIAGLLLAIVPAHADEHVEMRAALHEMLIARNHLQVAGHDYGGHRRAALDHVNQALAEIREALKAGKPDAPRNGPATPKSPPDDD